jgi:hypothetical protein
MQHAFLPVAPIFLKIEFFTGYSCEFSSSLRSFLHLPVTSSLFVPNILLSTLFSDNFLTNSKPQAKLVLYILLVIFL